MTLSQIAPRYTPGLLALTCNESARYSACYASICGIQKPAGSKQFFVNGLSIAENWNRAANELLSHPELEWMFLMNDDHVYESDVLLKLLSHKLDAVTGVYVDRVVPFGPVLFDRVGDERGHVLRYALPSAPSPTLVPIVACGDGAMLVSRKVFEAIQPPWWSFGVIDSDRIDHDLAFCQRIREAGFQIYADLETIVDHMTPMVLRPVHHPNGSWAIEIRDRQGRAIEVQTVPPFVEKEQAV